MTKERKAAIEQWQSVKSWIKENPSRVFIKPDTAYDWDYNCWLCHYLRCYGSKLFHGCERCPLNKWALAKGIIKSYNDFGCTHKRRTLFDIVCKPKNALKDRLEACDLIIRALKGEYIWED